MQIARPLRPGLRESASDAVEPQPQERADGESGGGDLQRGVNGRAGLVDEIDREHDRDRHEHDRDHSIGGLHSKELMQIAHAALPTPIPRDVSARLACWRASYVRADAAVEGHHARHDFLTKNGVIDSQRKALRVLGIGLAVAALVVVAPYWAPLLLAAWAADLLHPAVERLERLLGGRRRSAAAVVVLVVVAFLVPVAALAASVVDGVRDLFARIVLSGAALPSKRDWGDLLSRHGADAWRAITVVTSSSASALLSLLVFVVAFYALAASGARGYRWLARRVPLSPRALSRMTRAFRETGRGLIIGGGGTALVQGLVATIAYVVLGIPHALVLGPLTALCALVPVVGTGLVWVPLAIELGITGDYVRATAVVIVGAGVHSLIDNLVRPVLTRHGRLNLPTSVVLVSMLGGISIFGAAGALLGPLVVRLAVEALAMMREDAPRRLQEQAEPKITIARKEHRCAS